jgi:hypothetical protein
MRLSSRSAGIQSGSHNIGFAAAIFAHCEARDRTDRLNPFVLATYFTAMVTGGLDACRLTVTSAPVRTLSGILTRI